MILILADDLFQRSFSKRDHSLLSRVNKSVADLVGFFLSGDSYTVSLTGVSSSVFDLLPAVVLVFDPVIERFASTTHVWIARFGDMLCHELRSFYSLGG